MKGHFPIPLADAPTVVSVDEEVGTALFEERWAAYVGATAGVSFASAKVAYEQLFSVLPLREGANILVSACSTSALWHAIDAAKLNPVIREPDPYTLLMDASGLDEAAWAGIDAVVITHLFGRPAALESIVASARKFGVFVIEDALHAHGAEYRGRKVGSFGDAAVVCFSPGRIISDGRGGGLVVTAPPAHPAHLRAGREAARGNAAAMADAIAARLNIRLEGLPAHLAAREQLAEAYREHLGAVEGIRAALPERQGRHVYYRFVIRLPKAEMVLKRMADKGIELGKPVFRALLRADALPVSRAVGREILFLPMALSLGDKGVVKVCGELEKVVAALGPSLPG